MDRCCLFLLANVIIWSGQVYGQQADEKRNEEAPAVQAASVSPTSSQPLPVSMSGALPLQPPINNTQPRGENAIASEKVVDTASLSAQQAVNPGVQTPLLPSGEHQPSAISSELASLTPSASPLLLDNNQKASPSSSEQERSEVASQVEESHKKNEAQQQRGKETEELKKEESSKKDIAILNPESAPVIEEPRLEGGEAEEPLPEIVGIDTVNMETASGNWLLKRIWFERAQEQYEKTKNLFDKVLELRFAFFAKRTELDRTLFDPFYMKVGIGQGELLEVINRLLQDFQEMRNKEGALTEQENMLYERVEQEKETLERLQKDITGVTEIDAAVEAAINQLVEQVNTCRNYEKQSWDTFKEIAKQLSDKKARELYYAMDTYRKNSANIVTYLQRDFSNYMQLLERMAHEQIDRIMTSIEQLKTKNVDFREQAQRLEQKRSVHEAMSKSSGVNKEPLQETELPESQGIIAYIGSMVRGGIAAVWDALKSGVNGVYEWFWPSTETPEVA